MLNRGTDDQRALGRNTAHLDTPLVTHRSPTRSLSLVLARSRSSFSIVVAPHHSFSLDTELPFTLDAPPTWEPRCLSSLCQASCFSRCLATCRMSLGCAPSTRPCSTSCRPSTVSTARWYNTTAPNGGEKDRDGRCNEVSRARRIRLTRRRRGLGCAEGHAPAVPAHGHGPAGRPEEEQAAAGECVERAACNEEHTAD